MSEFSTLVNEANADPCREKNQKNLKINSTRLGTDTEELGLSVSAQVLRSKVLKSKMFFFIFFF